MPNLGIPRAVNALIDRHDSQVPGAMFFVLIGIFKEQTSGCSQDLIRPKLLAMNSSIIGHLLLPNDLKIQAESW